MKLYIFDKDGYFEKRENYGKPSGIAITVPARFFDEYPGGEKQFRYIIGLLNESGMKWGQTISGIPKLEVDYVYLVFGGKVKYRCSIHSFEKNVSKEFGDGGIVRCFNNKNWVNLIGPVEKAPSDFWMKGFQGFRYMDFIF